MKRLLLLSNSTNYGEDYLAWPESYIKAFLGGRIREILFIPWAGVTVDWDEYSDMVAGKFNRFGYRIRPVHREKDPVRAVQNAEAIMTGGGNTFHLVYHMHRSGIIPAVREKTMQGTPYIGWSAGSNAACPALMTTNDMPVIEPESFNAFHLIPFQINPHYTEKTIAGHGGETREMRLNEFIAVNENKTVVGLPEGSLLEVEGTKMTMKGSGTLRIFRKGMPLKSAAPGDTLDWLLMS